MEIRISFDRVGCVLATDTLNTRGLSVVRLLRNNGRQSPDDFEAWKRNLAVREKGKTG